MQELERDIAAKPGGEEWLFEQLSDGRTVASVAAELGVSRRFLYVWRDHEPHGPRRKAAWAAAVRMSAEADVDNIERYLDSLETKTERNEDGSTYLRTPTSAEVQLVTGRMKYLQWRASKKDPATYGEKTTTEVNVNLGIQHLTALQDAKRLRAPVQEVKAQVTSAPEPAADYETVEGSSDEDGLAGLM